jgi:hypothetical protein
VEIDRAGLMVALLLALPCASLAAQRGASARAEILAGLRELQVELSDEGGCAGAGLDTATARAETELALKRLGIRIVESSAAIFQVDLLCNVAHAKNGTRLLTIVTATEGITEWVRPARSADTKVTATTWSTTWLHYVTPDQDLSTAIVEQMKAAVSRFESDWRSATPTKRPSDGNTWASAQIVSQISP